MTHTRDTENTKELCGLSAILKIFGDENILDENILNRPNNLIGVLYICFFLAFSSLSFNQKGARTKIQRKRAENRPTRKTIHRSHRRHHEPQSQLKPQPQPQRKSQPQQHHDKPTGRSSG